ncbi:MAG: 50S ribosomal protein L29 [Deltaproteobacteria bacterium SM23_61]|nr:MAG: 50S ribosomal protein L29 [Deltaproteobacteria bacterium SM23_61]
MKAQELKEMSEAELRQKEKEVTEELFNLKFQHATGQLENTERLPQVRRDLARVKTVLRQKEIAAAKSK